MDIKLYKSCLYSTWTMSNIPHISVYNQFRLTKGLELDFKQ